MDIKELLDDVNPDPKKYFNDKEYSTFVIDRDGFNTSQNQAADLVEKLLSENVSRSEFEDALQKLKNLNAGNLLVEAIKIAESNTDKARLAAACWESGIDFTQHFMFFIELTCSEDFVVAMEALTVIENIEGKISESDLTKAMEIAQNCKTKNSSITEFLIHNIKERIS